jgi:hypothetical protein
MAYVQTQQSLPRSLDVQISVSKPTSETRTNLSVLCVVDSDLGFLPDADRIRYYSSLNAVGGDFATTTEVYHAAQTFFAQSPRATTMAIAQEFETAQPAINVAGVLSSADITALATHNDGSMSVTVGAVVSSVTDMDFTGVTTLAGVVGIVNTRLAASGAAAACTVRTFPGGGQRLVITSTATGDTATMAFPIATNTGTFVGALLRLTSAAGGKVLQGYTPTGIADELTNISNAANTNGIYVYGWCLAAPLRIVATQTAAAAWALGQTAMMPLVTNDPSAYDPAVTNDLGSVVQAASNRRTPCLFHDDPLQYPDVSILAFMLSVNYQLQDSTVTAKFKQLPGIPTVQLSETQWAVLQSKGYNSYTSIGNSSMTYRDGTTEDTAYFMDSTINLDNFVEDLSVNVFNVFLRNGKIPYTRRGQMMLVDACKGTGNQYVFNGTFADRDVADSTQKSGYSTVPAIQVIPTPIFQMSTTDRANRVGPPIQLIVQEAGAIHTVAINVEVVS